MGGIGSVYTKEEVGTSDLPNFWVGEITRCDYMTPSVNPCLDQRENPILVLQGQVKLTQLPLNNLYSWKMPANIITNQIKSLVRFLET